MANPQIDDRTTVLMYHAVDGPAAPAADPHYSVSASAFASQLHAVQSTGRRGTSVLRMLLSSNGGTGRTKFVALTFDDGHASNRLAADMLAAANMTADFFVNPTTIGLPGFLSWSDLREMHGLGMSIQSHGMHHRYLSDLSAADVQQELTASKAAIEQKLGSAVTLFAPPGGRMPSQFASLAALAGYVAVCTSTVGYWRKVGRSPDTDAQLVPRLAMLNATDIVRFKRWITGHRVEMWKMQARGALLQGAKRAVGNQRYDKLRQAIVGGPIA